MFKFHINLADYIHILLDDSLRETKKKQKDLIRVRKTVICHRCSIIVEFLFF